MPVASLPLSLGALVGIALSGGFVWWEVGRYATPQVPETLFDERRELFGYTAGLFVGVPIAVAFVLFALSLANGALLSAVLFLLLLVGGTEVAQWALLRSRFWGGSESGPFYALGYRSAIGGIVSLAIVTQYFSTTAPTPDGVALAVVDSAAVVGLEVAGALLSLPRRPGTGGVGGGPVSGVIFGAIGFFLLGIGPVGGEFAAFAGALIALSGATLVYRRLRPMLAEVPVPSRGPGAIPPKGSVAYGRTDRTPGRTGTGRSERP